MPTMTDSALAPCPFCGEKAEIRQTRSKVWPMIAAQCVACLALVECYSAPEAIAAWNRRPSPGDAEAKRAAVAVMLGEIRANPDAFSSPAILGAINQAYQLLSTPQPVETEERRDREALARWCEGKAEAPAVSAVGAARYRRVAGYLRTPQPAGPASEVASKALAALLAWDRWEGSIISEQRCWEQPSGLPLITQEIWDAIIPLQEQRNAAIALLRRSLPFKDQTMTDTPAQLTEEQIKHMVDRFLGWSLPSDFNPDGGVSFKRYGNEGTPHQFERVPSGTNLLDARQAEAMVRHMIDGLPAQPAGPAPLNEVEKLLDQQDDGTKWRTFNETVAYALQREPFRSGSEAAGFVSQQADIAEAAQHLCDVIEAHGDSKFYGQARGRVLTTLSRLGASNER